MSVLLITIINIGKPTTSHQKANTKGAGALSTHELPAVVKGTDAQNHCSDD